MTDVWSAYNWLNNAGYHRLEHNHWRKDWGHGLEATSHAENIWNVLKDELKNSYKAITNKNFLYFLREAEFKYVNRNKTNDEMLKEFFDCFNLFSNFEVYGFEKDSFFLIIFKI